MGIVCPATLVAVSCGWPVVSGGMTQADVAERARMARAILLTRARAAATQPAFASDPTTPT